MQKCIRNIFQIKNVLFFTIAHRRTWARLKIHEGEYVKFFKKVLVGGKHFQILGVLCFY